eukprot:jgi/Galph1/4231/GphlegSOOS_G2908.1
MALKSLEEYAPKDDKLFTALDKHYLSVGELCKSPSFGFFVGIHLLAATAAFTSFRLKYLFLAIGSYCVRMFAITAGYHRYFSHRSFKTGRIFQFILAFVGCTACQKGVLWWASWHRHHHRNADKEDDVHSPQYGGFWWSHLGWFLLSDKHVAIQWSQIPDLTMYKELVWLEYHHFVPPLLLALFCYATWGFEGFVWVFALSTVVLWHATFTVNSFCHMYGYQKFLCEFHESCNARNNPFVALLTLGEGWHNNHHSFMSSSKQGFEWWELDPCYCFLKFMSFLGIVHSMKKPSYRDLHEKRLK